MPITEDDYQHLYFYARPPVEKSPLLYTWQDKFYHTHHEKDPTYTVTRMPKLRAEQMMKTYVYQQEWRMNGWVNQIKLDFSKYYLEEYYENGVFLYYIERPKQKESNEVEKKSTNVENDVVDEVETKPTKPQKQKDKKAK